MGEVLQYLLGAGILGVLVSQLLTERRECQQRQRERDGLLRIVFSEVHLNQSLLWVVDALYHARSEPEESRMMAGWSTLRKERIYMEAWEATRVQLAQHLQSEKFAIIASYYSNLMKLKEEVSKSEEPRKPTLGYPDDTPEVVGELYDRGRRVEQIIKEYVPDVTTDAITVGDLERRAQRRLVGLDEGRER